MHFPYRVLLFLIYVTSAYSASISRRRNRDGIYTCYECIAEECENPLNKTCNGLSCFTAISLVGERFLLYERGCHVHPFISISCQLKKNSSTEVVNCCERNFCNDDEFPNIPAHWDETHDTQIDTGEISSTNDVLYFSVTVVIVIAMTCTCFVLIRVFNVNSNIYTLLRSLRRLSSNFSSETSLPSPGSSGCRGLKLIQRCISQDITLDKCIGQGRFGSVYQGKFHGQEVAIKIFPTTQEASWKNEVNVYTKIALYHESILGFKGSVIAPHSGSPKMWLLTAYHKQGSLYDYLSQNTITYNEMIEFALSFCSGLLHLHTEIICAYGKPAIAHRDLKARNILLSSQGTCVIADFGHAIVSDEFPNEDKPINYKVGTKRYMAPEILDDSIKANFFESFKRIDIYAFGLILWEICSRCAEDGSSEAYRLPYHDCVPSNPDFADMKKVVCIESKRPEIPDSWLCKEPLKSMANLMKDCWHTNPEIRLTACRVKKILDKLHADLQELQSADQSA